MRIRAIECRETKEAVELSADIDGFRLWYRFPPDCRISTRGDVFLAAALQPAMRAGETLVIENAAVSPRLLANVDRFQDIHSTWDPAFHKVRVEADTEP